jgi:hypothetical protein
MKRNPGLAVLVVTLIPAVECGYFRSGTWVDDPKNYARAWGYSKPDEIDLVHSWYRRSPHFTREDLLLSVPVARVTVPAARRCE